MLDVFVRLPGAPRWHTLAAGSPTIFKLFPALADRPVDFDRIWVVYLVDEPLRLFQSWVRGANHFSQQPVLRPCCFDKGEVQHGLQGDKVEGLAEAVQNQLPLMFGNPNIEVEEFDCFHEVEETMREQRRSWSKRSTSVNASITSYFASSSRHRLSLLESALSLLTSINASFTSTFTSSSHRWRFCLFRSWGWR